MTPGSGSAAAVTERPLLTALKNPTLTHQCKTGVTEKERRKSNKKNPSYLLVPMSQSGTRTRRTNLPLPPALVKDGMLISKVKDNRNPLMAKMLHSSGNSQLAALHLTRIMLREKLPATNS